MVGKYYFTRVEMETIGCTCRCLLPVHPLRSSLICRDNLIASGFRKTPYCSLPPLTYRWSCSFLKKPVISALSAHDGNLSPPCFFYLPTVHGSVSADVRLSMKTCPHVSLCMLLFCTSVILDTRSKLPCCVRAPLSR